ncbi:hypothetical protein [Agathobaculum sp.]
MEFDYAKEPGRELLNSNRVSNDKPSVSRLVPDSFTILCIGSDSIIM